MPVYVILLYNLIKISVFLSPGSTGRESGTAVLLSPVWLIRPPCHCSRLSDLGHLISLGVIFLYLWQDCITSRKAISNHKAISRRGEQVKNGQVNLWIWLFIIKCPSRLDLMRWLSHQKGQGDLLPKLPGFPRDIPGYKREMPRIIDAGPWLGQGGAVAREQPQGTVRGPQISNMVTW